MLVKEATAKQSQVYEYPLQEVMAISTGPLGTFEQLECGHQIKQPIHDRYNGPKKTKRTVRRRCRLCPKIEGKAAVLEMLAFVRRLAK